MNTRALALLQYTAVHNLKLWKLRLQTLWPRFKWLCCLLATYANARYLQRTLCIHLSKSTQSSLRKTHKPLFTNLLRQCVIHLVLGLTTDGRSHNAYVPCFPISFCTIDSTSVSRRLIQISFDGRCVGIGWAQWMGWTLVTCGDDSWNHRTTIIMRTIVFS
jgi:hypothetical protein